MNRRTLVHGALWLVAFLVVTEWAGKLLISAGQTRRDRTAARQNWDRVFRHLRQDDAELGYYLASDRSVPVVGDQFQFTVELRDVGGGIPLRDDGVDPGRGQRWLVLGDEVVWGHGVDGAQTFCELLEETDPDRDVINAGMPGYTVQQSTRLLRRLLDAGVEVDTVLFTFNTANDCRDEYDFRQWVRASEGNPTLAGPETFQTTWLRRQVHEAQTAATPIEQEPRGFLASYADRWLALSQLTAWSEPSVETDLSLDPVPAETINPPGTLVPLLLVIRSHGGPICDFSPERVNQSAGYPLCDLPEDVQSMHRFNLPLVEESFQEAAGLCEERGLRFVVMYLPTKEMVAADLVVKRVNKGQRNRAAFLMHRTRRRITAMCQRNEFLLLDPTPEAVRRDYSGVNLFHNFTGDWNAAGHQLLAEFLDRVAR